MKLQTKLYFALIFISSVNLSAGGLFGCERHKVKLLAILSLVCNTTQTVSIEQRDACYGCFFRAATLAPGPRQLLALSQCAIVYMEGTGYQLCAQGLATVAIETKPKLPIFRITPCTAGYCEFIRCIRRTNANLLVNACFLAGMVNRDFALILDRLSFYENVTACILAKARCSPFNPITGELQQQLTSIHPVGLTNSVGTAGFFHHNALQIAPNGDIRIIAFPSSTVVGDFFCSTSTTLAQSPYDGVTCIVP